MAAGEYIWCTKEQAIEVANWLISHDFKELGNYILNRSIPFYEKYNKANEINKIDKFIFITDDIKNALSTCEIDFVRERLKEYDDWGDIYLPMILE